jgi:hypothetical protein
MAAPPKKGTDMLQPRPVVAAALAAAVLMAPAWALAAQKELTPQQQRMGACAHEAKGKKGAEYKAFMKECLKSKKEAAPAAAAAADAKTTAKAPAAKVKKTTAQTTKMKECNVQAGEKKLKGNERKKFMSDCLKA